MEIEFMIKHSKNFTEEYIENERIKIYEHLRTFSKKNNMYDFYLGCYILLEK